MGSETGEPLALLDPSKVEKTQAQGAAIRPCLRSLGENRVTEENTEHPLLTSVYTYVLMLIQTPK